MLTPKPTRRWFHLSPDRFVIGLLVVVGLLWLSERFQWFSFNHHKGWTVLIAVATVGVVAVVMLLWWIVSLIFGGRFQFGIRSLLVFCLACSIAAGWLAVEIEGARRQAEVNAAIRSSDGRAILDWQVYADNSIISNPRPPAPDWLRNMLGDDFFSTVVLIAGSRITDAELEHLKELAQLRALSLNGIEVTDARLEHLKGLTQLRDVWLFRTLVTDSGVEQLGRALPYCRIHTNTCW